jgi:hypothetical protein
MGFARAIFALIVIVGIGLVGYQIGISQTIATQLPAGSAPVAYYGYPYHFGFGFLGFLFPLFFLFLIFGLLRAAMFGGRGGWGKGGPGYMGRGWGDGRARIEELHRELHGEKPSSGGASGGTYGGPSGPTT